LFMGIVTEQKSDVHIPENWLKVPTFTTVSFQPLVFTPTNGKQAHLGFRSRSPSTPVRTLGIKC
jgi:hypothetical protein